MKLLKVLLCMFMVLSLSACGKTTVDNNEPEKVYDVEESADLVIVGAGAAGISAALSAVENGAESVIVLEKTSKTGGALNTTSGTLSAAMTKCQDLDGLTEDSIESYVEDLLEEGSKDGGVPRESLIRLYANNAAEAFDWLWDNGLKDNAYTEDKDGHKAVFAPEHTLYSYPRSYKPKPNDAKTYKSATHELLDVLLSKESKIKVVYNTEARHLAPNADGQIMAVEALTSDGKECLYTSNKGILMATGGFSGNSKLVAEYSPLNGSVTGNLPTTDGWGLRMMQEVGGEVKTDEMFFPFNPFGLENKALPGTGRIMSTKTYFCGGILINKNGERFVDETSVPVNRQNALAKQEGGMQYEFFTDNIVENLLNCPTHNPMWNMYFTTEAGQKDIITADTLEEFSALTGVPYENLKNTIEVYNAHVDTKDTDEFGRIYDVTDNVYNAVIDKIDINGPFHAVVTKCMNNNTLGGISVNDNMQVVTEDGTVIPGLYAAGECVAVWGRWLSSGTGVNGAVTFGRIAGKKMMENAVEGKYEVKPASNLFDEKLWAKDSAKLGSSDITEGIKDGTYQASVDGQEGVMTVEVVVKDGKIAEVNILENHETQAIAKDALETLPGKIVEANGLDVDAVSGASLTSMRIANAVSDCLAQAK